METYINFTPTFQAGSVGSALACAGFSALSLLKFCRYYDAWSVSHSMARQRDKLLAEFYRYEYRVTHEGGQNLRFGIFGHPA